MINSQLKLDLFKQQRLAILVDDAGANTRAVLFAPAKDINSDQINRMLHLSTGLLFVALSPERSSSFLLSTMSRPRTFVRASTESESDLNMCISVEAREGVSTGISASDRATTIRVLGEKNPIPRKLVKPGHIFPVVTRAGGVLVKHSLPEGTLDIVKLSGFTDAAAYMDLTDGNGHLISKEQAFEIARKEKLPIYTLTQLTEYRLAHETLVERVAEAKLPTAEAGELRSIIYKSILHEGEHVALVKGEIDPQRAILTRVQAEHTFADVFGGKNPPARQQLKMALKVIGDQGNGIVIYLRRPLRGQLRQQIIGQDRERSNTMMREYGLGSQILRDLGVSKIELLTSSARDFSGVRAFGLEIVSQRSLLN